MKSSFITRLVVLFSICLGLGLAWFGVQAAQASQPVLSAPAAVEPASALPAAPAVAPNPLSGSDGPVRLLASSDQGLTLELTLPPFEFEDGKTADGQPCQSIIVEGFGESDQSGWPRLPARGAMLGIPAFGEPKLTILEAEPSLLPGRYDLCPVETPILSQDFTRDGPPEYSGWQALKDPAAYATNGFIPARPAELDSTGFIRSQRVAQLRLQPFQYNPASGELRANKRLRVRLDFPSDEETSARAALSAQSIDEGAFEDLLGSTLLNYAQARDWRYKPAPAAPLAAEEGFSPAQQGPAYKVLVDQDGIYELSYSDLVTAGLPVKEIDPRTFQLHNQGQEVAIYVEGEADGEFEAGDYLLFYGQKMDTKYTDVNVYWLTWGNADGKRMDTLDGAPGAIADIPEDFRVTRRIEKNLLYNPTYTSGPDHDHWYWEVISASKSPVSKSYEVEFRHIASSTISVTVKGLLRGFYANPFHHTRIYLNGHLIDDALWDAMDEYFYERSVPQDYLIDGINTLTVECPMDNGITQENLYVNWFEITYARAYAADNDLLYFTGDSLGTWNYRVSGFSNSDLGVFDVTTPNSPFRVLNAEISNQSGEYWLSYTHAIESQHRYIALASAQRLAPINIILDEPSNLTSSQNGTNYIIITHSTFTASIIALAEYREAQGLSTMIVDVEDVYDEFSDGIFDPQAIRDFLSYAYSHWEAPAPSYVLLVGDGNYDFKNYGGHGELNYVPPYLADVDPWLGETASDNRYVSVSGEDIMPDMHIGRLPVKTSAEAAGLIAKILGYEQNSLSGDWNRQVLFVADNADIGGDFAAYSDAIADVHLPPNYSATKVYYKVTHFIAAEAQSAIIAAINQGRLLVSYVGHAGINRWAQENLVNFNTYAALTNGDRLPFMAPMSCLEGYFIYPSTAPALYSSIGESLVRLANKGAIASFSPAGFGVASGHDYLERGLFRAFFYEGVTQVGPAATWAKLYLYANTADHHDLIETYVLFGDPAVGLRALKADLEIRKSLEPAGGLRPGEIVTYTLTYSNMGDALATRVLISDTLPAALLNPQVTPLGASLSPLPGSQFAWQVADLAPGEGGVITISAQVDPAFSGELVNSASISTAIPEARLDNNRATLTSLVAAWRLYLPAILNYQGWDGD